MKLRSLMFTLLVGLLFVGFTSCDDDEPVEENEEEVITTMTVTLTPVNGGDAVTLNFLDLDGDGGNAPTISGGSLAANTSYNTTIDLLNESEDPAESITEEVEEEADEHQFFFQVTGGLNLSFSYSDADSDGNPIGLETLMVTGDASSGSLRVTLRHEPDKNGTDVKIGDITNAGGETDIEVDYPITIQ